MTTKTKTNPTRRSVLAACAALATLPATVLAGPVIDAVPPEGIVLFVDGEGRQVLEYDEATGRAKILAGQLNDEAAMLAIPVGGVLTRCGDGRIPHGSITVRVPRSVVQAACEGHVGYLERNGWAFLVRQVVLGIPA